MSRTGARSLLYGSALGLGGVLLLGSFALRYMDVSSPADFKQRMQSWAVPYADSIKASLLPVKDSMRVCNFTVPYAIRRFCLGLACGACSWHLLSMCILVSWLQTTLHQNVLWSG